MLRECQGSTRLYRDSNPGHFIRSSFVLGVPPLRCYRLAHSLCFTARYRPPELRVLSVSLWGCVGSGDIDHRQLLVSVLLEARHRRHADFGSNRGNRSVSIALHIDGRIAQVSAEPIGCFGGSTCPHSGHFRWMGAWGRTACDHSRLWRVGARLRVGTLRIRFD